MEIDRGPIDYCTREAKEQKNAGLGHFKIGVIAFRSF